MLIDKVPFKFIIIGCVLFKLNSPVDDTGEILERFQETFEDFPSGKLIEMSLKLLSENCRISLMRFPNSLISERDIIWMRGMGIDVDDFTLNQMGEIQ